MNNNFTMGWGEGWAASQLPTKIDFSKKLRQFFPNTFNSYLYMKKYIANNPNSPYPNTPWSTVYQWFAVNLRKGIIHETGHNFNLGHQNSCTPNIMNQNGNASGDFLSNNQISTMHLYSSTSNLRQYFTVDSFKNSNITITNNHTFDLNFRLYSNVKVDNNTSLKATCKIIMAPESRFIVKDGNNFIMEGAEITSTNPSFWNGIKVEGNGYFLINPDTEITGNYFYAYADNTPLPNGKMSPDNLDNNFDLTQNVTEDRDFKIYPNPTGDFINIDTKLNVLNIEIYNLFGQYFKAGLNNKIVDVRNLPKGNYILKIITSGEIRTIHFMKK